MKKNLLKIALLSFLAFGIWSCDEDKVIYDVENGQSIAAFRVSTQPLAVLEEGDSFIDVIVDVSTSSPANRTLNISIDPASTVLPSEYTLDAATVVIPAGKFNGMVRIHGNFNALPEAGVKTLIFNLDGVQGATLVEGKTETTISLFRACPIIRDEFVGTYDAVEDGIYQYECVVTAGVGPNDLVVSNLYDQDPNSATKFSINNSSSNPIVTLPNYLENFLYVDAQYGNAYVDPIGVSTFNSCLGTITLNFRIRVSAGTYPAANVVLTRQ